MNPTLNEHQSLLINSFTNKADLTILFNSCEEYMIGKKDAKEIIFEVVDAVRGWEQLANQLQISQREKLLFRDKLNRNLSFNSL